MRDKSRLKFNRPKQRCKKTRNVMILRVSDPLLLWSKIRTNLSKRPWKIQTSKLKSRVRKKLSRIKKKCF